MPMTRIRYFLLVMLACPSLLQAQEKSFYTLRDLVKTGLENSPSVQQAAQDVVRSRALSRQSFSYFVPDVSLTFNTFDFGDDTGFSELIYGKYSYTAEVSQPVFAGGKILKGYRNARMTLSLSSDAFEKAREDLSFEIIRAYYNALKAEDNVVVAEESLRQVRAQKEIAQASVKAGTAVRSELLRVEVGEARIQSLLTTAQAEREKTREILQYLLGARLPENFVLEKIADEMPEDTSLPSLEELLPRAMNSRRDAVILNKRLDILENTVAIARADFFPSLQLVASQTKTGTDFPPDQRQWLLGAEARWSIFEGGLTKGKVEEARAEHEKARKSYDELLQNVRLQIRTALLDLKSSLSNIAVSRKAIDLAEENLRLTELQFKEGVVSSVVVLDDQVSLINAKVNYYDALYTYRTALARLNYESGNIFKSLNLSSTE